MKDFLQFYISINLILYFNQKVYLHGSWVTTKISNHDLNMFPWIFSRGFLTEVHCNGINSAHEEKTTDNLFGVNPFWGPIWLYYQSGTGKGWVRVPVGRPTGTTQTPKQTKKVVDLKGSCCCRSRVQFPVGRPTETNQKKHERTSFVRNSSKLWMGRKRAKKELKATVLLW
jgi:hypothetical protein